MFSKYPEHLLFAVKLIKEECYIQSKCLLSDQNLYIHLQWLFQRVTTVSTKYMLFVLYLKIYLNKVIRGISSENFTLEKKKKCNYCINNAHARRFHMLWCWLS